MAQRGSAKIDKRRTLREPARLSLLFWLQDHEELPAERTTTLDISPRSLAFRSSKAIPMEARLVLKLHDPSGGRHLQVRGRICRIEKDPRAASAVYGVQFDQIDGRDQDLLERFVQVGSINAILSAAARKAATDVHLLAGSPPVFRIGGEVAAEDMFPLGATHLQDMIAAVLSPRQREIFERDMELDFSYQALDGLRFRGNVRRDKGSVAASFRAVPAAVPTPSALGLPPVVEAMSGRKKGLFLIVGLPGSGRSTTMASLVDAINRGSRRVVVSLEDVIEFVHAPARGIVIQREIGLDTPSYEEGLRRAIRQDADVIALGEMRTAAEIGLALGAAEAGRLVLAGVEAADTVEGLDRLSGAVPDDRRGRMASRLAGSLIGAVAQVLLPRKDGSGRALAAEVMEATAEIRDLVRSGALDRILASIESGAAPGSRTMDAALADLVERGVVSRDIAASYAREPLTLKAGGS
jgi:twitching motility protein PilT